MAEIIDISSDQHRRLAALLNAPRPNRMRSIAETAQILGIHVATLYRMIAAGTGPRVTRVSPNRRGISDYDREIWLEGRPG
jgi:predicted DNA-binding transcriptional regulator AlpA